MNAKLKIKIQTAIDRVLENSSDHQMWDGYIHEELTEQMTDAAEAVFDSAMKAQEFAAANNS